jgi:acetylornithine deacetylase/succinyl-diaminopimelate desuccinylase-like protein
MRALFLSLLLSACAAAQPVPDWPKVNDEILRHFQALVQIDTTTGNEARAVDYLRRALEAEGIPVMVVGNDPARPNLIARLKGNGAKKPLLLMGHTDTVQIDAAKWPTFGPFSAARQGGYLYGRGTQDDRPHVAANLMTLLLLKRLQVPLDRDVIFVAEAGEESATTVGIEYLIDQHAADLDAEYCFAEVGTVLRRNGKPLIAFTDTAEKLPKGARLIARGPAGHGSRPMRSSAIVHLSRAVEKVAMWDPPMRLNDTTRTYFEKLATVGTPEEAARYKALLDPKKSAAAREFLAEHDPDKYSKLHTSISPTILKAGFQINVIPSEAEATLDIRALPDEDMTKFMEQMRQVIADPAIEIVPVNRNARPPAPPSRLDTEAYRAIQAANQKIYGVPTAPELQTGATDMAFLRARGMQCYGTGPLVDEEDGPKGFGPHSDQERLLEDGLYKFMQFTWETVTSLAWHRL